MTQRRILIVSNRLPITTTVVDGAVSLAPASGGLATGLQAYREQTNGLWIGWPGVTEVLADDQRLELDRQLMQRGIVPIHLTAEELHDYYEEFSNSVLWPLFHYLLHRLPLGRTPWSTYVGVNRRFADAVVEHYGRDDLVWVHDYQLMLVPAMVRERLPSAKIGFFLHIPFPAAEIFRVLPWRHEILGGLLGADVIGFHTFAYQKHFSEAVAGLTGAEADDDGVWLDDRRVRFGVFPMGIDVDGFEALATSERVSGEVDELRAQAGERKIILGVDRLDYTKGILRRLLAFESLLKGDESLRDRIRLLQVAVPSRAAIPGYQDYRRDVEEMIGRINGTYATLNSVPIHYLYQSVATEQLVALYRAADVMLVTSLRDGMNLVAKEFVACRVDEDGVLVLSEFAGAAEELQEAVLVNAYDIDAIVDGMRRALAMGERERRRRMRALRGRVTMYDVQRWADHFIGALAAEPQNEGRQTPDAVLNEAIDAVHVASSVAVLLDYDGTLVPLAETPDDAQPDGDLLSLIDALAERPSMRVLMVSGRSRRTLEDWFGALPIELWAEHGVWFRPAGAEVWAAIVDDVGGPWLETARTLMYEFARTTPGAIVESKTSSVAWHFRRAARGFGAAQARDLRLALSRALADQPAEIIEGKRVIVVRPRGASKGQVVQHLLSQRDPPALIVAFGDDRTDEEMFAALPRTAISIHVGAGSSLATHRLRNPRLVRAFLNALLDRSPSPDANAAGPPSAAKRPGP